LFANALTGQF